MAITLHQSLPHALPPFLSHSLSSCCHPASFSILPSFLPSLLASLPVVLSCFLALLSPFFPSSLLCYLFFSLSLTPILFVSLPFSFSLCSTFYCVHPYTSLLSFFPCLPLCYLSFVFSPFLSKFFFLVFFPLCLSLCLFPLLPPLSPCLLDSFLYIPPCLPPSLPSHE